MTGRGAGEVTLRAARIFDGLRLHEEAAIVIRDGRVAAVVPRAEAGARAVNLGDATLAPGFVDWQVNGGGGVMLNDDPTPEGVAAIARTHAGYGTTALLPTLITDAPAVSDAAAEAVAAARRAGMPGVVGIHFEGPHLSLARQGAHEAGFIRPLEESDHVRLTRGDLGQVVTTLAPENATMADIRQLAGAGVIVSLGHSDCDHATASRAFAAGARAVTHLFNAMSQFGHRAPGLVGAALEREDVWCGLIADGHHVHPAACRVAIRAKPAGRITLVTDAMATVGTDLESFELNGRRISRLNGRLELADGTLAGSDLDMASAVRFAVDRLGLVPEDALRMASLYPAQMLGIDTDHGHLQPGARADIVALDPDLMPVAVWIGGDRQR